MFYPIPGHLDMVMYAMLRNPAHAKTPPKALVARAIAISREFSRASAEAMKKESEAHALQRRKEEAKRNKEQGKELKQNRLRLGLSIDSLVAKHAPHDNITAEKIKQAEAGKISVPINESLRSIENLIQDRKEYEQVRVRAGLSVEELASICRVLPADIEKFERGDYVENSYAYCDFYTRRIPQLRKKKAKA